jgi:hypothetical protein
MVHNGDCELKISTIGENAFAQCRSKELSITCLMPSKYKDVEMV